MLHSVSQGIIAILIGLVQSGAHAAPGLLG
jgi:hypothetical protein